jgi:mannose-6-phosphate isomerase-like protein (cupin superfamily)
MESSLSDPQRPRSRPLEFVAKPWGSFSTLEEGAGYKIKRLVVLPGHRLSLQKHQHRSEHWVVVSGSATIVRGEERFSLRTRECAVIPRRAWHRIENRGRQPVVVIEVQHGSYLGEDDIFRKQDDYGRLVPSAECRAPRGRSGREPSAECRAPRGRSGREPSAERRAPSTELRVPRAASREPRRKGSRR